MMMAVDVVNLVYILQSRYTASFLFLSLIETFRHALVHPSPLPCPLEFMVRD